MYARASAPRAIGGVLDDAISLYRHSFPRVWPLSLAVALILASPSVFLGAKVARATMGGVQGLLALIQNPAYWLTYLAVMVFYVAIHAALICALDDFAERGQVSLGEALGTAFSLLPRLLGATILLSIVIVAGILLLVVPGIYLSGIFMLTVVVLIVERAGITESFGISRRLIKGYWWRSATIVMIGFIIMMVFSFIVGVINGVLIGVFGFGVSTAMLGQTLIGAAVNVFLVPLLPCLLLTMYFDLKLRHEGGDLAARVDALAAR